MLQATKIEDVLKKTNFKPPPKSEVNIMDNLLSEIKGGTKLKKVQTVEKRASNLFLNVPVRFKSMPIPVLTS